MPISKDRITTLALDCGFTERDLPDGTKGLKPYVEEFARAVVHEYKTTPERGHKLTFGAALQALKLRERIANEGWEVGEWAILVDGDEMTLEAYKYFNTKGTAPVLMRVDADQLLSPWTPTTEELLSERYFVYPHG